MVVKYVFNSFERLLFIAENNSSTIFLTRRTFPGKAKKSGPKAALNLGGEGVRRRLVQPLGIGAERCGACALLACYPLPSVRILHGYAAVSEPLS